jgi:iron complex transport system permease protein
VLTAATVALTGPIAFVGLVAPHAARVVLGPRHRPLAIGSAFAGAALLVAADAVRQAIDLGGGRLPVGVVTAIVGGPVFLSLLRRAPSLRGIG